MDPTQLSLALEQIVKHASRYTINLNSRLTRDSTSRPLRGSFADVYPGTLLPQTKVAIKVIRSEPPLDEEAIAEALQEVHRWSQLDHENVHSLLGISTDFEHTVSIVSPWMVKGNARQFVELENGLQDPRPLFLGIGRGLQYLHGLSICHGDLKGVNVLMADNGRPLLSDYGLSYLVQSSFSQSYSNMQGWTINWIAPENLDEFKITPQGDVWAFGMTMLELFTRQTPYKEIRSLVRLVDRITRGPPDRPYSLTTCFRMTEGWWKICQLCWARDPAARPSIQGIVTNIESLAANK